MKILYPGSPEDALYDTGIFLAGPTPRSPHVPSWRPAAIDILREHNFSGLVCVPEREDWAVKFDYVDQVDWELRWLYCCRVLAFWVPREMENMPALTTNVEFGMNIKSGRLLYGRPDGAPQTGYLDSLYTKFTTMKPFSSLNDLMLAAIDRSNRERR